MRTVDALKPLTAGELLELWRYYRERVEDPLERTLLCNAAILRDSCYPVGHRPALWRDLEQPDRCQSTDQKSQSHLSGE